MAPFVLWHRLSGTVCPHRHRLSAPAILYVRQSTSQQLRDHQESTARQYQLTERLLAFGWPQFKCMALFVLLCLSCCLSCQFKCMALFVPSALFVPTLFVPTVCPCLSLFVLAPFVRHRIRSMRLDCFTKKDLAEEFGEVWMPFALAEKYPSAPREFGWQFRFEISAEERTTEPAK